MFHLSRPIQEWRLAPLVVAGTLLCAIPTFLIVTVMGLILQGTVRFDYLLTAAVTMCAVAPPALALLGRLLQKVAQQRHEILSSDLDRADASLRAALDAIDEGIVLVAPGGEVLTINQRLIELWGLPPELAGARRQSLLFDYACAKLQDPDAFRT